MYINSIKLENCFCWRFLFSIFRSTWMEIGNGIKLFIAYNFREMFIMQHMKYMCFCVESLFLFSLKIVSKLSNIICCISNMYPFPNSNIFKNEKLSSSIYIFSSIIIKHIVIVRHCKHTLRIFTNPMYHHTSFPNVSLYLLS